MCWVRTILSYIFVSCCICVLYSIRHWYIVWPQPVPSTLVASKDPKKLSERRPISSSMEYNGLDMVHPDKSPKRSVLLCLLYISSSCLYWRWSNMFQEVTNDNEKHESNLSRVVASGRDMSCHIIMRLTIYCFFTLSMTIKRYIINYQNRSAKSFHSQSCKNIKSFYLGSPSL